MVEKVNPYADLIDAPSGPPEAGVLESAGDIAGDVSNKLVGGLHAVPGIFGDVEYLAKHVGAWLENEAAWLLHNRQFQPADESTFFPTTADYKRLTGFQDYKPKTAAGDWFDRNVGDFVEAAPAVIGTGGSGLVTKLVREGAKVMAKEAPGAMMKTVVAPIAAGNAVEAGLNVTPGVPDNLKQIIKTGTEAIVGGGLTAGKKPNLKAPSMEEIGNLKKALYKEAEDKKLTIPSEALQIMADDATRATSTVQLDPVAHPMTTQMMMRLEKWAADSDGMIPFTKYQSMRSTLGDLAAKAEDKDSFLAVQVLNSVDDFFKSIPADKTTGTASAAEVRKIWDDANRVARIEFNTKLFENTLNSAKNSAPYANMKPDDAYRTAFRKIANNPDLMKRFLPIERDTILEIVRPGSDTESILKKVGSFAITSGRAIPLFLAAHFFGGPGAIAAVGVTEGAKKAVTGSTKRNVDKLSAMIRKGDDKPIRSYPGVGRVGHKGKVPYYIPGQAERLATYYISRPDRENPYSNLTEDYAPWR